MSRKALETVNEETAPRPARGAAARGPVIAVAVTGALVASGWGGLTLNRTIGARAATPLAGSLQASTVPVVETAPLETAAAAAETEPPAELPSITARPRLTRLAAPPDPFQPPVGFVPHVGVRTLARPARDPLAAVKIPWALPDARKPRPKAEPEISIPADAPKADELAVIGLVQGEPPLAVVEYAGQQFYLKVGDQVADTWRLEEIKERSATFRLGNQRVEVPINGGRSQ